jgi:hypothetical protein
MIAPSVAARFERLTGLELPEHLQERFRNASPDMDWNVIRWALGDEITDQLIELNEPQGFQPIGDVVGNILKRIGVH